MAKKKNENVAAARAWLEEMTAAHIRHLGTLTGRIEELEELYDGEVARLQGELTKEREASEKEQDRLRKQIANLEGRAKTQAAMLSQIGRVVTEPLPEHLK